MGKHRNRQGSRRQLGAEMTQGAGVEHALGRARQTQQTGQWRETEICCRRVLEHQPEQIEALYMLAVATLQLGKLEDAARTLARAIHLNPSSALFHGQMGNILKAQNRLEEAAASYRKALEFAPGNPDHYCNLGVVLNQLGAQDEAIACYQQGLTFQNRH